MDYEELRSSMTVQDAVQVLKETNCYGTMDIAKSVILRALEQEPCEKCCNGNQEEKAKLCQKSYIAGMEHNCENEEIIKVSKGALKVRTGRYVIYDVEWLKKHFNTTEAKIYGQPSEDCISRKAILEGLASIAKAKAKSDVQKSLMGRVMFFTEHLPSITPQPKAEPQQKTGHWLSQREYCKMNNLIPSGLGCYFWCSECNCGIDYKYFHLTDYNYCPNCGAKMQEAKE